MRHQGPELRAGLLDVRDVRPHRPLVEGAKVEALMPPAQKSEKHTADTPFPLQDLLPFLEVRGALDPEPGGGFDKVRPRRTLERPAVDRELRHAASRPRPRRGTSGCTRGPAPPPNRRRRRVRGLVAACL